MVVPAAIPALVSAGAVWAASQATGWAAAAWLMGGALASYGAQKMVSRGMLNGLDDPGSAGSRVTTTTTEAPLSPVYGTRPVWGNDVYAYTDGASNEDLWIVQTLADHECEGILQVGGVDQVYLGDRLYTEYGDKVSYWFHSGSADQAYDANIHAVVAEWVEPMRHTCYIVWRFTYDQGYYQSLPSRKIMLQGRRLYDFRTGATGYSENMVLALYDYHVNDVYGLGMDPSRLHLASWTDCANYVDLMGWTYHTQLSAGASGADVRDMVCKHFRGSWSWWAGQIHLHYADLNYESPVMALTDEHIATDQETGETQISLQQPGSGSVPSGLRVYYSEPALGYIEDYVMVGDESGDLQDYDLTGFDSRDSAAELGAYALERMQIDRLVEGVFRGDALTLDEGDLVTLTASALAVSGQIMRVVETEILEGRQIRLVLEYETLDLYDRIYNVSLPALYTCTLPDRLAEPPGVAMASLSEEVYAYRQRSAIRLNVSFDRPANYPWFDHVQVFASRGGEEWEYLYPVEGPFSLENVAEGETYWLRLKVVNIWGRAQADANDYKISRTITGVSSDVPPSVAGLQALVSGTAVNLWADLLDTSDMWLYEYRLGTVWNSAIFLASTLAPNLPMKGVKPGTHTFLVNTRSTNGLYGATPRSAAVALVDPPDGYALQHSVSLDYTTGTHDNTEHVTYSSEDHLRCSHAGGVLTGAWRSAVIDRGSSVRELVYALAGVVVTGEGTTYDDIFPPGATFGELGLDRTWGEIMALAVAPQVRMTLYYGDINPPGNSISRLEILCAEVTGRYYQLEISVTDPTPGIVTLVEEAVLKFCQTT